MNEIAADSIIRTGKSCITSGNVSNASCVHSYTMIKDVHASSYEFRRVWNGNQMRLHSSSLFLASENHNLLDSDSNHHEISPNRDDLPIERKPQGWVFW